MFKVIMETGWKTRLEIILNLKSAAHYKAEQELSVHLLT
jgi:hypothetical protein